MISIEALTGVKNIVEDIIGNMIENIARNIVRDIIDINITMVISFGGGG